MWGGSGRLFDARRLLTFPAFRMGAYSRWALIRGWALIRINTVCIFDDMHGGRRPQWLSVPIASFKTHLCYRLGTNFPVVPLKLCLHGS